MDMIEAAGAGMMSNAALDANTRGSQNAATSAKANPHPTRNPRQNLLAAYRWAEAGYALIPGVAGALVAMPLVAILWTVLVQHQPVTAYHGWFTLGLIPAALLILAGWARFEKPDGLAITAADAPALFTLIEQLRAYLAASAIDTVYLTSGFAVRAMQRPSRGLFGGFQTEIVIGLPLLQSVTKAEAAVLIAQELAHVSQRQGHMAAEVHRARVMWQHIIDRQPHQPLYLRVPFEPVVHGFAHPFLGVSAAQEREMVFAADRQAAEIAGLDAVGSSLQRLKIAEEFVADYWQRIGSEPVTAPEPTLKPYLEMANFLPRMTQWEKAAEVLEAALAQSGNADPAHPTLAERLNALGLDPDLPPPATQPATILLGPALAKALDHFDSAWRAAAAPAWRAAFDKLSPETRRLIDLDALARAQPLDFAPALERAKLAYVSGGIENARDRYADLIEWHPEDGRAVLAAGIAMVDAKLHEGDDCLRQALELAPRTDWTRAHADDWFAAGQALLERGNDLGIECLEQAIRIDPQRADMATFLVDRYLDNPGGSVNAA